MRAAAVAAGLAALLGAESPAFAGNAVTRWMEESLQTVREANLPTPAAGRLYAMVTAAMYDAVNGIDAARGRGRAHAIVPAAAPPYADRRAAAIAAAFEVLRGVVPARAAALQSAFADDVTALAPRSRRIEAGLEWGASVGVGVVLARSADGTQAPVLMPPGSGAGVHRAAFDARFAAMRPFGVASTSAYRSPAPPALPGAAYAAAYADVKQSGRADGDPARDAIAAFWLAEGGTPRETGTWFQALLAIVEQQQTTRDLSATARLFALVGMAVGDAVAVSWQAKATWFAWRPAVAIREAGLDGNAATDPDGGWAPRNGSVGASPEYTSGTSTFAGAAAAVIERFYGRDVEFCFRTDSAVAERCYASPEAAAREAGRSRIYQGIHFQFSNDEGRRVGRLIGMEVAARRLRKKDGA